METDIQNICTIFKVLFGGGRDVKNKVKTRLLL